MITLTLENFDLVDKQLANLPLEVRHTALSQGLRAASKVVVNRAKELVPKPGYPGDKPEFKPLRDTIGYIVKAYGQIFVAIIGPQRPAGAHGHLVEKGTSRHEIIASAFVTNLKRPRGDVERKRALASDVASDDQIYGRRVNHPGAKPTPFLEPASKDTQSAQQKALTDSIDRAITKVTGKKAA